MTTARLRGLIGKYEEPAKNRFLNSLRYVRSAFRGLESRFRRILFHPERLGRPGENRGRPELFVGREGMESRRIARRGEKPPRNSKPQGRRAGLHSVPRKIRPPRNIFLPPHGAGLHG